MKKDKEFNCYFQAFVIFFPLISIPLLEYQREYVIIRFLIRHIEPNVACKEIR